MDTILQMTKVTSVRSTAENSDFTQKPQRGRVLSEIARFQELHERCVHPPSRPGSLRGPNDGSSLSDGQYEYAAAATACAANVPGVAARSLHKHVKVSRTRDQTGRNWDLQLLTADNRGAQGLPVDDNDRRRNKLAALYGEHSTLLHLSKIHRAR